MAIAGQKARSSYTPSENLDPDFWLTSRDCRVFTTTRFHPTNAPVKRWQEVLTFDDDAPRDRKVTSIIIDRQTGQVEQAMSNSQEVASKMAAKAIGMP